MGTSMTYIRPTALPNNELELATTAEAPATARLFAKSLLTKWDVDSETADSVVLVVSELVTNAARHAMPKTDPPSYVELSTVERLRLVVARLPIGIRVSVFDHDPKVPKRQFPTELDESGRGLMLVEAMTSELQVDQLYRESEIIGKVVRALIPF